MAVLYKVIHFFLYWKIHYVNIGNCPAVRNFNAYSIDIIYSNNETFKNLCSYLHALSLPELRYTSC